MHEYTTWRTLVYSQPSNYEPEGRVFESRRAHHLNPLKRNHLLGICRSVLFGVCLLVCLKVCLP